MTTATIERCAMAIRFYGYGRADFSIAIGEKTDQVSGVSFLCDILGEILRAAIAVGLGEKGVIAFAQEPGAERYVLDTLWDDDDLPRLHIRRFSFPQAWDQRPAEAGEPGFEAELADPDAFCRAALALADRIVAEQGMSGYMHKWDGQEYAFPLRAAEALRALLGVNDPPLFPSDDEEEEEDD